MLTHSCTGHLQARRAQPPQVSTHTATHTQHLTQHHSHARCEQSPPVNPSMHVHWDDVPQVPWPEQACGHCACAWFTTQHRATNVRPTQGRLSGRSRFMIAGRSPADGKRRWLLWSPIHASGKCGVRCRAIRVKHLLFDLRARSEGSQLRRGRHNRARVSERCCQLETQHAAIRTSPQPALR